MKPYDNRFENVTMRLYTLSEDFSLEAAEGLTSSAYYIARYLDEHTYNDAQLDDRGSGLIAAGRLDWLLRASRSTISGVFSEKDIFTLINCYQDTVFNPDRISDIPSDVCNDLGIKLSNYEVSSAAPLIGKLLSLDPLQLLILADTLERIWYQPAGRKTKQIPEVFESLGIRLK